MSFLSVFDSFEFINRLLIDVLVQRTHRRYPGKATTIDNSHAKPKKGERTKVKKSKQKMLPVFTPIVTTALSTKIKANIEKERAGKYTECK